jgi:hypothetical protein
VASLREMAGCIGLGADFRVIRDFFGFFRGQLPSDPTGADVTVSLRRQLTRLEGRHIHVNCIRIGSDQFDDTDQERIDYAMYRMRDIYHPVSLGVGRVRHYGVTTADANGLDSPTTRDDLEEITDSWTVPNSGIDLFFPANMNVNGVLGRSAVDGPCTDKDDKGMNGSVSGLWGFDQTARTVAHEIGHYLTLEHRNSQPNNLMCQSGQASSIRNSVQLTTGQGSDMRGHCIVRSPC